MKRYFLTLIFSPIFCLLYAQSELQLAEKQYELKAYDLAIESFEKYLEDHPDDPEIQLKLADAHRHILNLETARVWYRKAAEGLALTGEHMLNYGHLLCELGDYESAKNWYANYKKVDPETALHYMDRCDFAIEAMQSEPRYTVKREYMNTEASDFGVSFWKNSIVYASSRGDMKREFVPRSAHWTGKAKHQLFVTETDRNGFLKQPDFFRNDLKHSFNEAPLSFAPEMNLIAFTRNNFSEGTRQIPSAGMELSLFTAKLNKEKDWVDVKAFPFNYGNYSNGYPCLTSDGKVIYFASDRPDGYGGYDIYVSYNVNGTWSIPENMGPEINTPGHEITPYLEDDILYFASDYHHGLGGFDLFKATPDEKFKKWSIKHMGTGINSTLDDYGLIYDARRGKGYFTSNRAGKESLEDIYQFSNGAQGQLVLEILDTENAPIPGAVVDMKSCDMKARETDEKGQVSVQVDKLDGCIALVRKKGYKSRSFDLSSQKPGQNGSVQIVLEPQDALFKGKVIDAQTAVALDRVKIRIVDLDTYNKSTTYSGKLGEFTLDLDPNKSYTVVFSKPGYIDYSKTITTVRSIDTNLGNIAMTRAGTNLSWEEPDKTPIKEKIAEQLNAHEVTSDDPDNKPQAKPVNTRHEAEKLNDKEEEKAMDEAYAIQVEAIFGEEKPDLKQYADLADLGYIYTTRENDAYKVRLGMFTTHDEATDLKQKVKEQGYTNAFVVSEKGNKLMHQALRNVSTKDRSSNSTTKTKAENKISDAPYKIRLAAYKNPKWFQPDKVNTMGSVVEWTKGEWTIMLLDGFNEKESALSALANVKKAGFDQAYIVKINEQQELEKVD